MRPRTGQRGTSTIRRPLYPESLQMVQGRVQDRIQDEREFPEVSKPPTQPEKTDPYYRVKKELITEIVNRKLYKNDDLNAMYHRVAAKHRDLDKVRLDAIWQEIMDDLNS